MKRSRAVLAALLVLLTTVVGSAGVVAADGHGHAQTNGADELGTGQVLEHVDGEVVYQADEPNATSTADEQEGEDEVVARVDSSIIVTDYRYNASTETFYVTLHNEGEDDVDVTITEQVERSKAGATTFGITVVDVDEGETVTASLSARRFDGTAGVTILTPEAVEQKTAIMLQESNQKDGRLIKGDATGGDVRAGGFFAGVGAVVLVFLGAWQYVANENQGRQEANLDPDTGLLGGFRK